MSQSIDQAATGLAKILDPVIRCFTPEVANRVTELRADPAVQARIEELAEHTAADEVMVTTNVYDHAERLHSYELIAEVFKIATLSK